MNKEIEKLIDIALSDGILTDKEKEILLRKCEKIGMDKDELEMILEGRLFELKSKNQKEETKASKIMKCPVCAGNIPALSNVCEFCGHVINSSNSKDENSLTNLMKNIEGCLVDVKSLPKNSVFKTLKEQDYIALPILSILFLVLGIRQQSTIAELIFVGLAIVSYIIIRNKFKAKKKKKNFTNVSYENLKANFEKYQRTARTIFGADKNVSKLIVELNTEFEKIEMARKQARKQDYIIYGILALFAISVFVIPAAKTASDIYIENQTSDKELVNQIDKLISEKKYDETPLLINKLKLADNITLKKAEIQLSQLIQRIDNVTPLIKAKKYSDAKLELNQIIWTRISNNSKQERIERKVFKTFTEYKNAVNEQLPEKFKANSENEYSL